MGQGPQAGEGERRGLSLKEGEKGKRGSNSGRTPLQVSRLVPVWGFANQTGAEGKAGEKKARIKTNPFCLKAHFPLLNKTMPKGEERQVISHSLIIPMLSIIFFKTTHISQ